MFTASLIAVVTYDPLPRTCNNILNEIQKKSNLRPAYWVAWLDCVALNCPEVW